MKAALLGGTLAFAMWGGVALAGGGEGDVMTQNCPPSGSESSLGTGGSGDTGTDVSSDVNCPETLSDDSAMGGSGESALRDDEFQEDQATGGSGEMVLEPAPTEEETNIIAVQPADEEMKADENDDRGVTVLLGGGVEGYTGDLAPRLNYGPAWGVGVALKPTGGLGVELGYSGAINSVEGSSGLAEDPDAVADVSDEADIVRNGGSAVATLGGSGSFSPYVLGGVGIDRYNARNSEAGSFRDDTVGSIPLGVGLRSHIGDFTADLRGTYGVLFSQGFAPGEGNTNLGDIGSQTPTGRLGAQLRLGATF